ncbi:MAG: hypothetical protein J5832_06260 [Clostridia bacterium]|nr:hypothetical protein [Clostridia bacterium]
MKTLDEFIKEINGSKELQEELKNAKDIDAVNAFLKKHDCDATAEKLSEYIKSQKNDGARELSDDEVSEVAGGFWMDIGAGWFWVDDTIPPRKKKEEPVLGEFKIEIIEE